MFTELDILLSCVESPGDVCDISARFGPESITALQNLSDLGYLSNKHGTQYFAITPSGLQRIEYLRNLQEQRRFLSEQQAQQAARQDAKEKQQSVDARAERIKDRRHDYLVAAFGAIIGSACTLIFEHFLLQFLQ